MDHAVELQALHSADRKMQEAREMSEERKKTSVISKKVKTEKALKDITDALASYKREVK